MQVTELSYGEKIGLPNYSSAQLTVTAKLSDDTFEEAFDKVKQLVNEQLLQRKEEVKSNTYQYKNPDNPPTTKQLSLIAALRKKHKLEAHPDEVIETVKDASELIDRLLSYNADSAAMNDVPAEDMEI